MSDLPPGPELDALVAEKVFGCTHLEEIMGLSQYRQFRCGEKACFPDNYHWVAPYSTEIAAAWSIVEKLESMGFGVTIWVSKEIIIYQLSVIKGRASRSEFVSAPHAICLAALRAVR